MYNYIKGFKISILGGGVGEQKLLGGMTPFILVCVCMCMCVEGGRRGGGRIKPAYIIQAHHC